jgi:hypothetical protein
MKALRNKKCTGGRRRVSGWRRSFAAGPAGGSTSLAGSDAALFEVHGALERVGDGLILESASALGPAERF